MSSKSSASLSQTSLLQAEAKLAADRAAKASEAVIKADRQAVDKAKSASSSSTVTA